MDPKASFTLFLDQKRIATGTVDRVLAAAKVEFDRDRGMPLLFFDDQTGQQVDFDLRGTPAEVLARATPQSARSRPGRPKLGVVSREISLLPRHWEWLEQQQNGASAALRRLVEGAKNQDPDRQKARAAADAAGRFLSSMAGNLPHYEEAARALYSGSRETFLEYIREWPEDIRQHVTHLVRNAFLPPSLNQTAGETEG